ncbi:putative membrane protein YeiB [Streptosporangium album]|uniref:Putative membrane protein YeiB n=1 Tax=Streptosporangium album TaxID=47479 RepID=A0A7W7RQD5_9ACTN|nr:DUF418 domain-containing protein [Streptosporangium album]MBB4936259.1 putative membrane protein YeiB [Streptosporangium album]
MSSSPPPPPPSQARVQALDALRGLALGGILVVNITQLAYMYRYDATVSGLIVDVGFHQRFFPIFSFLFGIGSALFLESAQRRAKRPRLVLLRRLVILAGFGVLHHLAQPGEALLPYAVFGILFLLPASYLPRAAVLVLGVVCSAAALAVAGGGILLVPGLFLLGTAAARSGLVRDIEQRPGMLTGLLVTGLVTAAPMALWYLTMPLQERFFGYGGPVAAVAGLSTAMAYSGGFLLSLRTRTGAAACRALAPLGRMALTNYVTATALVLLLIGPLGMVESESYGVVFALAAAIIAVQAGFSSWWLGRFRYGPLEWLWRCGTWWQAVPLRASGPGEPPASAGPSGEPPSPHRVHTGARKALR